MYQYWATVGRIVDGDTLRLDVDLGYSMTRRNQSYRIAGISARETSEPGGLEAKANLETLLPPATKVQIRSIKVDADPETVMSLGRYVVSVTMPDGADLAQLLIDSGWAAPWDGKTKPRPIPEWPRI